MQWIKFIHICCVVFSFSGFLLRGLWMLNDSPALNKKWVKVVPHIIDTTLLLSALGLVYILGLSVFENDWLLAKIIALVVYVFLGTIALKRGKTKKIKIAALLLAVTTFLYIVSVAIMKSIYGYMIVL